MMFDLDDAILPPIVRTPEQRRTPAVAGARRSASKI